MTTTAWTSFFAKTATLDEGTPVNIANIIGSNDITSATISVTGGGAAYESAHGRDFINSTHYQTITNVKVRYRYAVPVVSGNWYLSASASMPWKMRM